MPRSETAVLLATVAVVATSNLAIGVGVGVLVACVLFARRVASSNEFYTRFDYSGDPAHVVIDLSDAHVWDASPVAALDAITHQYETRGKTVEVIGLSGHSADRYERHSGRLAGAH
jgi:SulP family sulfate permease